MLICILIWIYMLFVSFVTGYSFIQVMSNKKYICHNFESYILTGLGVLIVFSEAFSLVYKVGLIANIILLISNALLLFYFKESITAFLHKMLSNLKVKNVAVVIVLFLVFAYGTSHGYMHYDSDLYHAQSIRWIEEFGVIKGLGNIHTRLAYNSAAFNLTALFSMSFWGGQSYHVCAGFLAYMVALLCRRIFSKDTLLTPRLSNASRVVAIYYLLNIFDEMVAPASDYFMVLFLLAIVILFCEELENKTTEAFPYCILSLMCLIVLSIKISGAFICLLAIYPIILLINSRDFKTILKFVVVGIVTILPFILRNIILSGYFIYPVTGIDIFNFDYKIPLGIARFDEQEIQVYGRGYSDVSRFNEPIMLWIKDWFVHLGKIDKFFFVLALVSIVILAVFMAKTIIKKEIEEFPYILTMFTVGVCFSVWMLTSPNIRYGCVFLWLFPMLVLSYFYMNTIGKVDNFLLYKVYLLLFFTYKAFVFSREQINHFSLEYLINQQDYGRYEVIEIKEDNFTYFVPKEGDQTGYEYFPSVPYEPMAKLKSDNIKDGFIPVDMKSKE